MYGFVSRECSVGMDYFPRSRCDNDVDDILVQIIAEFFLSIFQVG